MFVLFLLLSLSLNVHAAVDRVFDEGNSEERVPLLPPLFPKAFNLWNGEDNIECRVDPSRLEEVLQGNSNTDDHLLLALKNYNDENDKMLLRVLKAINDEILSKKADFVIASIDSDYLTFNEDNRGDLFVIRFVFFVPKTPFWKVAQRCSLCQIDAVGMLSRPIPLSVYVKKSEGLHYCRFMSQNEIKKLAAESAKSNSPKCAIS
ncbi:MAG: hypothetical protein OXC30_02030 [Alphaproteobacteria bacterium]|nr:hypothetical protein [Alphaproteobacteria bacterium]